MARQLVYLEYSFMFDPKDLWVRLSDFEKELSNFFYAHGKDVMPIESLGQGGKKILYITKAEYTPLPKSPQAKPLPVPKHLKLPIIKSLGKK